MSYSKNEFFTEIKDEFKDLGNKVNKMFDDMMKGDGTPIFHLRVDVYETNDSFVFVADLPGMTKSEVKLQVKDNNLILKGDRKRAGELGEVTWHKKERSFGAFQRSFTIPAGVEVEGIKARFENGQLSIKFPKSGEETEEQEINID